MHKNDNNGDDADNSDADADADKYSTIFIHRLQKIQPGPSSHKTNNTLVSVYRNWYRQLCQADAFMHSSARPELLSAMIPTITPTNGDRSALPRPTMIENESAPFMAKEITDYIQKTNVTHCLKYAAKNIRGRTVHVNIMHCASSSTSTSTSSSTGTRSTNTGSNDDKQGVPLRDLVRYKSYVYKICAWFYFIQPYVAQDSACSKTIDLYFYFTPFKKRLPPSAGHVLGPTNANTGFTHSCNSNPMSGGKTNTEIIIFRHEEWFKVLLHETLHNLDLDFGHAATSLRDIFPGIRHSILLSEAYVETWARLLNLAFYVFYDVYGGNGTASKYNVAIRRCLYSERTFSLFQANKTLKYMGLSISHVLDTGGDTASVVAKKYRENTNIFAYYVLAGMLVFSADEFVDWCAETNEFSLIQASAAAGEKFKTLVRSVSESERTRTATTTLLPSIMEGIEDEAGDSHNTMRMTLWH